MSRWMAPGPRSVRRGVEQAQRRVHTSIVSAAWRALTTARASGGSLKRPGPAPVRITSVKWATRPGCVMFHAEGLSLTLTVGRGWPAALEATGLPAPAPAVVPALVVGAR